jgi:hypothetical protein
VFWELLGDARRASAAGGRTVLTVDLNQLCYALGWGLYWHAHGGGRWQKRSDEQKAFDTLCLDFYCSCIELQQKSIFTFLLFWNREMGVKDVGVMIGKKVWEGRENNLVKMFA